jgi:RluA family pseudouridine synthase
MTPEEMQARVLYRDALMLVIDKPPGIPVHKGRGEGHNLESYFVHLQYGLPNPPSLAHRLDKETSGCLILGRHRQALNTMGKLFAEGKVEKVYWAVVEGCPKDEEGIIDLPIRAIEPDKKWKWRQMASPDGQPAVTHYKVIKSFEGKSWLELKPKTGRTHQLRVHCSAMGFPIIGDYFYGTETPDRRLFLHARAITIPLYPKKDPITVEAPPPVHMSYLNAP